MEMTTAVKSEVSPVRRRGVRNAEGGDNSPMAKGVKRRRREPAPVADGCTDQGEQPQTQTLQLDPSSTTTTTTVKRSSRFRGVSRHRWTGRFEAHLWDKGSWNATQRKKGKQGAFDEEESAARAYDLAAIKYWGPTTFTNFPVPEYEKEIEKMQNLTKEEYLASLRRRSSGFSRGVSKYRGVARHHHNGRWEARIGRVFGNKYLYLGTYSTQEEAAHAYDIAAIEYRGINAVTNFDLSTYIRWLRPGANSVALQEPVQKLESPLANSLTNFMSSQEPPEFTFRSSPYTLGDRGNNMPRKQELLETKMPISPCNTSSSPTALGLLLRSSMFRELVEKNSNVIADDYSDNQNEAKKEPGIGGGDDLRGMFYSNIGSNPYGCSTRSETLQTQEEENTNTLPLYNNNKTGQSLWNVALNLPSN
ncbi:Ethylene-responsive transcription factor WRI1 [Camellia lanceoleosa]|uniref:Ethylene-responsive transcription factor WRI1 n=1 Tax=Camellia lanceoleosa TaxID=1840588 RepID=A0ACC0G4A4_9ERIC|nr:Ethylene-responsive transcription factor WRI1 [Camellia lanceoleosa]